MCLGELIPTERGQLVQGNMFGCDLVKAVERKNNTYKINPVDGAAVQLICDLYVNGKLQLNKICVYGGIRYLHKIFLTPLFCCII